MKQRKRLIVFMVLTALCISLVGCANTAEFDTATPLDHQRAEHAVFKDNEVKDTVIYNGQEYYLLKNVDRVCFTFAQGKKITLTSPKVPVLLREFFGDPVYVSEESGLIWDSYSYGNSYYCRADLFDAFQARLNEEFVPEVYGYPNYADKNGDECYMISSESMQILFDLLKTVKPQKIDEFPEKVAYASPSDLELYAERGFVDEAIVYGYSKDLLLKEKQMHIFSNDGTYYLTPDTVNVYAVPTEHNDMMREICAKAQYWK